MTRWRWPVGVLALVIVVGSGGYAVAQTRDTTPSYRTATASVGDVERTLDLSGTVTTAGRRDLSFGAAGAVSRVSVKAGAQVSSGRVLARLDPTSFDAAVTDAVATLAKAEAQLAADQEAQASAVTAATTASASSSGGSSTGGSGSAASKPLTSGGAGPSGGSGSSGSGGGSGGSGGSGPAAATDAGLQKLLVQLGAEQRAVTQAQSAASAALTAAKSALAEQSESCRTDPDSRGTPSPTPSPSSASASAAPSTGSDPDDTGAGDPGGASSAACAEALATVQAAQETVAQEQDRLQAALSVLGETLGQAVTNVSTPTPVPTPTPAQTQAPAPTVTPTRPSTPSSGSSSPGSSTPGSSTGGQGGSGSVTAARLAQDQADIDTARARLIQARAEREAATLRAPYAGRILRVDIAKGDLVAASDPAFVLVGQGETTVTTTVSTAQVPAVRRGQQVRILPAGWTTPLTGAVSAIGLLPDSDEAFPVLVTVSSEKAVAEGTTASVAIVTGSVTDVVTVPVTALTRRGEQAVVEVLKGGTLTRTVVGIGVLGARRASISTGLPQGATVVLADLGAAVPSATTQGGGFGGSGVGRAGLGGGGANTFRRARG